MTKAFHHIGIHVFEDVPGTQWIEVGDVLLNNPNRHPQKVEWIYHREGTYDPMHEFEAHIAYTVDNLEQAISGKEVVTQPHEMGGFCQCAFTREDGIQVEYIQLYPGRSWFDDEV